MAKINMMLYQIQVVIFYKLVKINDVERKYTEPTDIYLNFKNSGVPIKYCENRISDSFVNKYAKLF